MALQNISIQRVVVTSANTQKIVSLPATRVYSLRVQAESASVAVRLAFGPGVVTNGTGGSYWRIPAGGSFVSDDLNLSNPKVYLATVTGFTSKIVGVMSIT